MHKEGQALVHIFNAYQVMHSKFLVLSFESSSVLEKKTKN